MGRVSSPYPKKTCMQRTLKNVKNTLRLDKIINFIKVQYSRDPILDCKRVQWPSTSVMRIASTKEIPGSPFFDGVSFAPKGRFWSKLGGSMYRTIWLKTAVFPIWPRAKMGDFGPPKKVLF